MLRKLQKTQITKFLTVEDAPFKILILDEGTRDIVAPLFSVSDLRNVGVCTQFLLTNTRTNAKDVPVVYYVKDFAAINDDVCRFIYSNYYINCASQIKRNDLENLAIKVSELQNANRIKMINDTFTDFIALQNDLFILNLKQSYLKDYSREIVSGLFSVFITLDKNPFIVGNLHSTGLKNSVLKMLETKIKNTKMVKNTVKKPMLILVDRDIDLISPMTHKLGFLEIIDDLFNIELNKITIDGTSINIDTDFDFFNTQRFNDFVDVVDLINSEVLSYKKEMAIKNLNSNDVAKMLEVAPELQKKNEVVNNLLNISLKAVNEIKNRKIDEFYVMESQFEKNNLMELSDYGNNDDIIRLAVSFLNSPNAELIEPLLEKRNIKTRVINYIKKFLDSETSYGSVLKNKMKNLIFKKNLPLVNYVEDVLFKIKNNSLEDFYECSNYNGSIYYNEISEVIVFVNGGATYSELKGIKELEEKHSGIKIILGSTEMINASKLIAQIEECDDN